MRKGSVLILGLLLMAILLLLGGVFLSLSLINYNTILIDADLINAEWISRAGFAKAIYSIKYNYFDHENEVVKDVPFGTGKYTYAITSISGFSFHESLVLSTGNVRGNKYSISGKIGINSACSDFLAFFTSANWRTDYITTFSTSPPYDVVLFTTARPVSFNGPIHSNYSVCFGQLGFAWEFPITLPKEIKPPLINTAGIIYNLRNNTKMWGWDPISTGNIGTVSIGREGEDKTRYNERPTVGLSAGYNIYNFKYNEPKDVPYFDSLLRDKNTGAEQINFPFKTSDDIRKYYENFIDKDWYIRTGTKTIIDWYRTRNIISVSAGNYSAYVGKTLYYPVYFNSDADINPANGTAVNIAPKGFSSPRLKKCLPRGHTLTMADVNEMNDWNNKSVAGDTVTVAGYILWPKWVNTPAGGGNGEIKVCDPVYTSLAELDLSNISENNFPENEIIFSEVSLRITGTPAKRITIVSMEDVYVYNINKYIRGASKQRENLLLNNDNRAFPVGIVSAKNIYYDQSLLPITQGARYGSNADDKRRWVLHGGVKENDTGVTSDAAVIMLIGQEGTNTWNAWVDDFISTGGNPPADILPPEENNYGSHPPYNSDDSKMFWLTLNKVALVSPFGEINRWEPDNTNSYNYIIDFVGSKAAKNVSYSSWATGGGWQNFEVSGYEERYAVSFRDSPPSHIPLDIKIRNLKKISNENSEKFVKELEPLIGEGGNLKKGITIISLINIITELEE